jgi:hypothetical protein
MLTHVEGHELTSADSMMSIKDALLPDFAGGNAKLQVTCHASKTSTEPTWW